MLVQLTHLCRAVQPWHKLEVESAWLIWCGHWQGQTTLEEKQKGAPAGGRLEG